MQPTEKKKKQPMFTKRHAHYNIYTDAIFN